MTDYPTLSKAPHVQTWRVFSAAKSFRMRPYEIAYALTLLESHSYRKTRGVGGLIVNQNQPFRTTPSVSC